ncbi:MAG: UbiA family prenyltransferase [Acidimicrobiales bacterium]|nr:UbiA family prenyltransferase [Acidimicrobiales bacterium]
MTTERPGRRSAVRGWLRACHPGPTLVVTAITVALAAAAGPRGDVALSGAAVLAGQLSVGWSNDWIDRDRDRLAGRLDKPVAGGVVAASTVGVSAAAALLACVPLSLAVGWRPGLVHLAAVGVGWAYNAGLKRTVLSVAAYAAAFAALPAFVSLRLEGHPWPAPWIMAAAALLGAGAHFFNVLPDLDADRLAGVRGLPHRLPVTGVLLVGGALMAASLLTMALAGAPAGGWRAAVGAVALVAAMATLAAMVAAARLRRDRLAWSLAMSIAGWATVAFVLNGAVLLR